MFGLPNKWPLTQIWSVPQLVWVINNWSVARAYREPYEVRSASFFGTYHLMLRQGDQGTTKVENAYPGLF